MKRYFSIFIISILMACQTQEKEFEAKWESLKHPVPEWLLDAKFGIYAHWGVYSVPEYETEWYAKWMYQEGHRVYQHHVKTYGDPSDFGYKDLVPLFKAEHYDPHNWAEIIKGCGAKFAGFAVVHHDGFLLWDSKVNRWNAGNMGPKRDLYGELVSALRNKGIKALATFHHLRTFNWYLPGTGGFGEIQNTAQIEKIKNSGWDLTDPRYGDLYWNELAGKKYEDFIAEWQAKVTEVIDKYTPDLIWFDGGAFQGKESEHIVLNLLAHYQNAGMRKGLEVEVLNKLPTTMKFNFPKEYGMLTFEEGRDRPAIVARPWIDDMRIGDKSWSYVKGQTYRPANEIIDGLIDRVARGGGLVLNLSPKSDGTIPETQQEILREIGQWLQINGEGIYATRPWVVHGEGDTTKLHAARLHSRWDYKDCDASDIRFTRSKDGLKLYAFALDWPGNSIRIRYIEPAKESQIYLLGYKNPLKWEFDLQDGLLIHLPQELQESSKRPCQYAYGFRINGSKAEVTSDPEIRVANERIKKTLLFTDSVSIEIRLSTPGTNIYYTRDGSMPSSKSMEYNRPINLKKSVKLNVIAQQENKVASNVIEASFIKIAGIENVTYLSPYSQNYRGSGDLTLFDHQRGSMDYQDGKWMGFEGLNLDVLIELERETSVDYLTINCLQSQKDWIFLPTQITCSVSKDGKNFQRWGEINQVIKNDTELLIQPYSFKLSGEVWTYIKLKAKNVGTCPDWHAGAGGKAWLFVDEIIIN